MILLYSIFILMLCCLWLFPAAAFIRSGQKLLSPAFLSLLILSTAGAFSLYALTGSANALKHFQLLKTVQEMGGLDAVIRKIEKRVAEHPDDTKGKEILRRLRKHIKP